VKKSVIACSWVRLIVILFLVLLVVCVFVFLLTGKMASWISYKYSKQVPYLSFPMVFGERLMKQLHA